MTQDTAKDAPALVELEPAEGAGPAPAAAAPRDPLRPETGPGGDPGAQAASAQTGGGWFAWIGGVWAILWLGGGVGYLWAFGFSDLLARSPVQLTGLAALILAPAMLFLMFGFLGRELSRSAYAARRIDMAVRRLAAPNDQAVHEVRSLSDAVTGEVERINTALESALARLAAMEEVISHHADALEQSAGDARDRADNLLTGLRKERVKLGEVSESLDDKAALIAAAISDQSKMVAAAAELAASQAGDSERRIRDSLTSLENAGADLTERSDLAAGVLSARASELRDLSDSLKERSDSLDAAYIKHRKRLGEAGEALRQEQEKIAAALDFHRAELDTMATTARGGADALNDAAQESAKAFHDSVGDAIDRANRLASHVRSESENAAELQEAALARLVAAAQEAKAVSEAAITAVEAQADAVESKVERTNEASFEAARRADEAFESRIAQAEKLTSKASRAAEDAAEAVRTRLEAVLASAKAETQAVERQVDQMTERLEELPKAARERASETADALRRGLDGLNAAALAAAEEAQEIDAAFQARIRQNYELLSDFMLRMGSVAGGRRPSDLPHNELPDPFAGRQPRAAPEASADSAPEDTTTEAEASEDAPARTEKPMGFPERGRGGAEPGWRWKDLLSTMNPGEDEQPRRRDGDKD
jgi:hypothetical protein